jgi:hypothetical protein
MVAAPYQKGKLTGQKPTSAQLCKHRDGLYYLHVKDNIGRGNSEAGARDALRVAQNNRKNK